MPLRTQERTCADCGGSYSPAVGSGGKMPPGHRICPLCGSGNTEFIDRLAECGGCGGYHRKKFYGDCRSDKDRFSNGLRAATGGRRGKAR